MKLLKVLFALALSTMLFSLVACGGGGAGTGSASNSGQLSLGLVDATTDEYKAVYVTIKEIQVNVGGQEEGAEEWQVVASPNKIVNLIELVNGVMENLGLSDLPAGHYTRMRLIIGEDIDTVSNKDDLNLNGTAHADTTFANYLIKQDDSLAELKVPSGYRTGIKLVHDFDIVAGATVDLILDFDAAKSIVRRGSSGAFNLKPTIKVVATKNNAILAGTVTDSDTSSPIGGALVTAQVSDPSTPDQAVVYSSTLTDESGNYTMFLPPGHYLIVATNAAYSAESAAFTAETNAVAQQDLQLDPVEKMETVSGSIILDLQEAGTVTIVFTQSVGTPSVDAEIASLSIDVENYAEPVAFDEPLSLPYGTYKIVASLPDHETKVIEGFVVDAPGEDIGTLDWSTPAP